MSYTPNTPYSNNESASKLRNPRAIVTVNDTAVKWSDIEINSNGGSVYIADNYRVELPLNRQPQGFDLAYWASTKKFTLKIYIGFPNNLDAYSTTDLDFLIVGDSNEVEIDLLKGCITIEGRDLSSRLIDAKITKNFANYTSSQVAAIFASQNNLKSRITNTTTLIGNFYQTQQNLIGNNTTQWDLLVNLAQQENFLLFLDADTLVFETKPTADNTSTKPYLLKYLAPTDDNKSVGFNGETLKVRINSVVSGNVSVTVKVPYSAQTGKDFAVKMKSTGKENKSGTVVLRKYVYSIPGLTEEQATQKAAQLLADLTSHGTTISTSLPLDNALKKDSLVQLTGTNTVLDQIYYPDQITKTFNMENEEFGMWLSAKNKFPDQEAS